MERTPLRTEVRIVLATLAAYLLAVGLGVALLWAAYEFVSWPMRPP